MLASVSLAAAMLLTPSTALADVPMPSERPDAATEGAAKSGSLDVPSPIDPKVRVRVVRLASPLVALGNPARPDLSRATSDDHAREQGIEAPLRTHRYARVSRSVDSTTNDAREVATKALGRALEGSEAGLIRVALREALGPAANEDAPAPAFGEGWLSAFSQPPEPRARERFAKVLAGEGKSDPQTARVQSVAPSDSNAAGGAVTVAEAAPAATAGAATAIPAAGTLARTDGPDGAVARSADAVNAAKPAASTAKPRFVRPAAGTPTPRGETLAVALPAANPAPDAARGTAAAIPALPKLDALTSLDVRLPKDVSKKVRILQICGLIEREAKRVGMDPAFFARLINKESRFDPYAVSPVGAQGVAQFMPYTAKERGLKNPFEPVEAIPASADYLAELRGNLGNWAAAAAGYNAGPGRVIDWRAGRSLPAETRDYVYSIALKPASEFMDRAARVQIVPLDPKLPFMDACRLLPTKRFSRPPVPGDTLGSVAWQPWGVQLSASFVRASAVQSFDRQVKRYGSVLKGQQPLVITTKVPGLKRSKFAARIGAPSRKAADKLCGQIRRAGGACLVVKNKR